MPDYSTLAGVQLSLLQAVNELRAIDRRLAELADSIAPGLGHRLPDELESGTQCVRSDLLSDAIETLEALGQATEESVIRRRRSIDDAAGLIVAFG
ncbi:MAG: hypothetical protein AAF560_08240 [Acidobacteriota bacterium]